MYVFLRNFSSLKIHYLSVTVLRLLVDLCRQNRNISFLACAVHIYFFLILGATECFTVTAKAYDRYVPFATHYSTLSSWTIGCVANWQPAVGSVEFQSTWGSATRSSLYPSVDLTSWITFSVTQFQYLSIPVGTLLWLRCWFMCFLFQLSLFFLLNIWILCENNLNHPEAAISNWVSQGLLHLLFSSHVCGFILWIRHHYIFDTNHSTGMDKFLSLF